ncbi:hypothetical protein LZ30DRAFT_436136 [Colletotrichum cereale]|nr:hypothetical protein LZ30DRAFT_436136 [Colletotrichum cereale]
MRGAFPSVMVFCSPSRPSHRKRIPSHPRTARRNSLLVASLRTRRRRTLQVCHRGGHYPGTRRETCELDKIVASYRTAAPDPTLPNLSTCLTYRSPIGRAHPPPITSPKVSQPCRPSRTNVVTNYPHKTHTHCATSTATNLPISLIDPSLLSRGRKGNPPKKKTTAGSSR